VQLSLISIGGLISLAHLHKGAGFLAALQSALWSTADRTGHSVYEIGSLKTPILGYDNPTITAGGKDTKIQPTLTAEGDDKITYGVPSLHALDVTLRSPRLKNVNFLQPSNLRSKHNLEQGEASEADAREGVAPMIAPKLAKVSHHLSNTSTRKRGRKKSAASETEPPKLQREGPSRCSSIAPVKAGGHAAQQRRTRDMRAAPPKADSGTTPEQKVEGSREKASGRAAGRRKTAKLARSVDKAKSAPTHSGRVKCGEDASKDEAHKAREHLKHVDLQDDGEAPPAPRGSRGAKAQQSRGSRERRAGAPSLY
jgi:hypothetical protein